MTAVLSPENFDELYEYIRVQVALAYASVDAIVDEAVEVFVDTTLNQGGLRDAARAVAERAAAAHLGDQAGWPETTDCDRLDAAFAELETTGILARQHFSCCSTCGSHDIRDELDQARKAGHPARGFTFFHIQDSMHAVAGEPLYLSYGVAGSDRTAAVAIGHEVVDVLGRHGLAPSWNGKFAHRIALPLQWQRRLPVRAAALEESLG